VVLLEARRRPLLLRGLMMRLDQQHTLRRLVGLGHRHMYFALLQAWDFRPYVLEASHPILSLDTGLLAEGFHGHMLVHLRFLAPGTILV